MEVGFLGLGIMGRAMALNLLRRGFRVTVWNRTLSKCEGLVEHGASIGETPAAVVSTSKYTIAMLADPSAALSVVFGKDGVLERICEGKNYIDMSTVDADTSSKISEAITKKGGRFLEAPVSGSKKPAEDGQLIILAAGDNALYDEVLPAFDVLGKKSFYLGSVGNGAKMKLIVNMIMGSMMKALSEGLSLAGSSGLNQQTLLDVLDLGAIANPMFRQKGPAMIQSSYPPAFPLKHQQKDIRLALALGDENSVSMPVAAAANEDFKRARSLGLGDLDFSAVHEILKAVGSSGEAVINTYMEGGHSLYELGHKAQDLPGRMNSEIPENSKISTPLLFLKEAPAEGHHLEELANNGITAAIPLSKYPLNPVHNALALTSIDELDEGLHKKLPHGTRLLVSVPPDEPRERLLKLKEHDNVDFIFLEEPSIQTDTVPSQSSELEAYLKGNGIDLKVISWSNLPRINFRKEQTSYRGSTTNTRELQHELLEYVDLSAYMVFNKHMKQHTDYTRHLIDDPDFSKSISTNINDSGIGSTGRVYEF